MALALSQSRCATARPYSARKTTSRRPMVVRAGGVEDAFNWVGQAFVKIFSPPSDNGVSWSGTTTPFKGSIAPHGAGKPFKDNYVAGGQVYSKVDGEGAAAAAAPAAAAAEGAEPGVMDYVGGALERVVGHNFTGDESEPDWDANSSAGWKGDLHPRGKDGFHTKKF